MKPAVALAAIAASLTLSATAAEPATASLEANKALVAAFYHDVFQRHDFDAAARYLSEDYRQHSAISVGQGRAAFISAFKDAWAKATDAQRAAHRVTILDLVAEGDRVVIHTRFVASRKDGTRVTGTEFDMFEVAGGRIVGHWSAEPPTPVA